ncbi:MAG TPA: citrate/2-methylcitrate synthase [Vicinamibacteria bacterium]|nr:citrate/2-methylcitrate synthase [Vicinamibacteria bacterium]
MAERNTETARAGGGLRNVVAGQSAISTIDGQRGLLSYRGIDIHELAQHSTFEETVFLLHEGRLPTASELSHLGEVMAAERAVPEPVLALLRGLPVSTHPMAALRTAVSALSAYDPDAGADEEPRRRRLALRLVAQSATLVAAIERARHGQPALAPDRGLGHAASFLSMLTGQRPQATAEKAMDVALVLHADHEFNASTFAARVAASTLADMHGAVTAALATLKGPLHGGANEAVMRTLEEIGALERAEDWVRQALRDKRKIMGFGHAVYRTEDPRATHLRRLSRVLGEAAGQRRWYDLSERVEAVVRQEKGFYPNVDFYSASLYHVMGIPTDLFTPVFAVSRMAGWTAHVLEQWSNNKLIRPESDYVGRRDVRYVPLAQRA